jgi:hypothetical protein
MDTIQIPGPLPATVTRPRPLIEAVIAQSLREQGYGSHTARAWQWVLSGHGPSPVAQTPGTGNAARGGRDHRRSTPRHHTAGVRLAAMAVCQ